MFLRSTGSALSICALIVITSCTLAGQDRSTAQSVQVSLRVSAGTPLRLYLTRKVPYRIGAPAQAKLAAPVWSFDRIVIPAGTVAIGRVTGLQPVPRVMRAAAIVGGNFTPLKNAEVCFEKLILPGGKTMGIQTRESFGLHALYAPPRANKGQRASKSALGGKAEQLKQLAKSQVNSQINARTQGLWSFVRGQNRREWLEEFLLDKLPYRPQWYRSGTLFNAVLASDLDFGEVRVARAYLQNVGTQPAPDSVADMRILSNLSSADARAGDAMKGELSAPVFSADHKLLLPQGTRVTGKITLAQHARLLHRGGKLRFVIEDMRPPEFALAKVDLQSVSDPPAQRPVRAQLAAVEADPKKLKVDDEGTARATESKTRLLHPVVAALVAAKSLDNDTGKQSASGNVSGSPNTGGLALGGFSGFGTFGILAARGPAVIGSALGFYGLAWSVFSNVIARGSEVTFPKNTAVAIRFGNPPPRRKP
jgi:hypothetical protein